MKAHKAREKSIEPQYKKAMEDIKQAINWGQADCHIDCHGELYPEVAQMLVKDGFDIKIVLRDDPHMTYNAVSWRNAKKGREGTLTYVDERKKNFGEDKHTEDSDLTSIFIQALFHGNDETEDEDKNGESVKEQEVATDEKDSEGPVEETADEESSEDPVAPSEMTDEEESNSPRLVVKESVEEESNSAELEAKETGCSDDGEEQETAEEEVPAVADAEGAVNGRDVLAATGGNTYHQMWNEVVSYMDDDIREKVHAERAPCTKEEFLAHYLELNPSFLTILENIPSDQEIEGC